MKAAVYATSAAIIAAVASEKRERPSSLKDRCARQAMASKSKNDPMTAESSSRRRLLVIEGTRR
jgi:hypothetical protein